jgi:TonB family protein
MMTFTRYRLTLLVALIAVLGVRLIGADDGLARAKELYLSADYEQALSILNGLPANASAGSPTEVSEYRVFCLLALQRTADAQKSIEEIVRANPFYQPSEELVSPRIRSVFHEVRQGLLPSIVQQTYTDAKNAFDHKDPAAGALFDRVLKLLDDPDVKELPSFSDLRTISAGFRDLTKAMDAAKPAPLAPAKPPTPAAPAAVAAAAGAPAQAASPASVSPASVSPAAPPRPAVVPRSDAPAANVVPPVAVFQPMPQWGPRAGSAESHQLYTGTLEITIDEQGRVIAATIPKSIQPQYDLDLIKSAKTWRFQPATVDGMPSRYIKVMEIQLKPVN